MRYGGGVVGRNSGNASASPVCSCGGDKPISRSEDDVKRLTERGRRAMEDYYDYKYLLYKEIYEDGSVP